MRITVENILTDGWPRVFYGLSLRYRSAHFGLRLWNENYLYIGIGDAS